MIVVHCTRCAARYRIRAGEDPAAYQCQRLLHLSTGPEVCGGELARPAARAPTTGAPLGGAASGAVIGGALGGPAGALLGAGIGLLLGLAAERR